MADYYTMFSFTIPTKTEAEREWIVKACEELETWLEREAHCREKSELTPPQSGP